MFIDSTAVKETFVIYLESGHVIINYDVYGYPRIFPLHRLWINTILLQLGTRPKWVIRKYEA